MGAYLGLVGPGVPILGAFMYNAIYKFPAYRFECVGRVHQHHVHRRLPRRRAARGDVRDRADHGRARRRARAGPDRGTPAQLDQRRRVPVHHGRRARPTTRATTRRPPTGPMELFGYDELRREQEARRASGDTRAAGHRHLDVHRDVRPGAVAGAGRAALRRRRLGVGEHPDAAHRQGRGRHRHVAARPGPRDGVEPDRRRPARRRRSTTSRCCTATPARRTRVWTPTGRGRSRSAASRCTTPARR